MTKKMRKLGILVTIALVVSIGATTTAGAAAEKTITYALGATWGSLLPLTYSSAYTNCVQSMIYDRLVVVNEEGKLVPRAAESWEVSQDGKTFTFHLRKNSYWHDGVQCTANDWVFAAEFFTNPMVVAPQKVYLNPLVGIDSKGNREKGTKLGMYAKDDFTLVMELDLPSFAEIFLNTANLYYLALPKHLLSKMDPANWSKDSFWMKPVGNGPFKFVSEVSGHELVLAARRDYYFPIDFDKLIFKVMAMANIPTAMMAGEIDAGYPNVKADEAKNLQGKSGITVRKNITDTSLMFMTINVNTYPQKVRQAMAAAIDKQLLVDKLIQGEGAATCNMMMPSSSYYNPQLVPKRDVAKAKQLLAEAKWNPNTVVKMGVPTGIRERIAAIIQQYFAEVGIKMNISVMDTTTLFRGMRAGSIDCGLVSWPITPCNPVYFQTQLNPANMTFACIKDNTYMPLINAIKAEQGSATRIKLVQELEALIVDESALVPLFHEYNFILSSSRVTGITLCNTDAPWDWKVK